ERLVRPPHAELAPNLVTAQPLSRTVQQVWPNGLRLALAGAKARTLDSRGLELSPRLVQSRLGRSSLAESRACPKPRYCRGDCRCLHRACNDLLGRSLAKLIPYKAVPLLDGALCGFTMPACGVL